MAIETICRAVREKRCLSFFYKFELRKVEPHECYTNEKGNTLLFYYQTSGIRPDFRNFDITKISNLLVLDQKFLGNRSEYKPHALRNRCILHCRL